MTSAFEPIELGGKRLANRIAMAPMTRSRAFGPGAAPTPSTATYYAQRASAGLIVTEGVQPSVVGQGYPDTPGLHSAEQVAAWRTVTDAVHREGGTIFAQLMHTGRIGHRSLLPDGLAPVAPSAVTPKGRVFTHEGPRDFETPEALDEAGIRATIADFAAAARNAIAAGFDGVEVHGANGYLVHQFLAPNANRRTDGWGGSVEGRVRFAVEVVTAVAEAVGAERTGLRISPGNPFNDIAENDRDDLEETYGTLLERLAPLGLAYLHLMEGPDRDLTPRLRKEWPGTFLLNPFNAPGFTGPEALALVENGAADMVVFGALFLANPDLPRRLRVGGPFNTPDRATFYGGGDQGYTDYPALPA
ncbi:alkene reductase [Streptomyces mobaraensis NBRC 13819 = DSM 40847]|uniref:Putative NADH:flavin oxidoreductase n=1 Tax=Streptomyces mobaraensis (strain ATCC 29032 / DSM 40847 / JCM 4168 / NBRC 13819 / NCIMB 11159 / IPCR 16-22) TaxID=1223523 RepID=M3BZV6_STRM1|nr:alkene reductase [Streptomyces mobaraensis]EME97226.1 putative NADH:flavin oxidoreductase [Streptomyces mobaraensis NBRC 13819 = DSM 40847]QTT72965.1 alkene reductase [Streptomyces mobaraensis NBRC 13819 = DSM 40847]